MAKTVPIAIIVLAAGKGTRMRSDLPKVLHKAAGRSLLGHVLDSAKAASPERDRGHLAGLACTRSPRKQSGSCRDAVIAIQEKRQGTGHAVSMAHQELSGFEGTVLVLYGDVPLIRSETITVAGGGGER